MLIHSRRASAGFTVIELAIVMVLSGLLVAAGFSAYNAYLRDQRSHEAYEKQKSIATSIAGFANKRRRLPCPADPTLPVTNPNAGYELPRAVCQALQAQPDGTCWNFAGAVSSGGVCKTSGRDTAADLDTLDDAVLIGGIPYLSLREGKGLQNEGIKLTSGNDSSAVPPPKECKAGDELPQVPGLRQLNPAEVLGATPLPIPVGTEVYCDYDEDGQFDPGVVAISDTSFDDTTLKTVLDPYGFQMTYAVSYPMTLDNAKDINGAVGVETEAGTTLIQPARSAHYVLLAHGDNHMGAYTTNGVMPFPCVAGTRDAANCDGDGIFMQGIRSVNMANAAGQAEYFDDVLTFRVVQISSLWAFVEGSGAIYNLNAGFVGVGTPSPLQMLDVRGAMRASTNIQNMICDASGVSCFDPDNLAGNPAVVNQNGDNIGSLCNTTSFPPAANRVRVVVGIKEGRVKCSSNNPADPDYDPLYPDPVRFSPALGATPCNPSAAVGDPLRGFLTGFRDDGSYICQPYSP